MAAITAKMVKDLREKTDLPMMECKQALSENDGNIESAMEWLKKKHKGKLSEREGRTTGEGCIMVVIDDAKKIGAIIELQCETASVAQNEMFLELATAFANKVAGGSEAKPNPEDLRKDPTLDEQFTNVFGKLRETMNLTKCQRVEGAHLASYVHHDGKSGVLLALEGEPKSDKNIAGDLCMHSLFSQPLAIDRNGIPAEKVEAVRKAAMEMAATEGKNESISEKIATGKVGAYYSESVLLDQFHVKTDEYGNKAKIRDILKEAGVSGVSDLVVMKVGA